MLSELTKLATEKSSEKRLELMTAITDMFIENTANKSTSELELFGDVFTRLLSAMDDDSKLEISSKFARVKNTPKIFAIALIYEDAHIAAPMLENSSVFNDDDLINATNLTTMQHRIAIAKRDNVSEAVTDSLIGHGETAVLRAVGSNETAHISNNGFTHMVKYNADDGELLAILLQREDLPKDVKMLLPHLGGGVLTKVARVADAHSKAEMQDLIDDTHQTREDEQKADSRLKTSSMDEVNQIRNDKASLNDVVIHFAAAESPQDVARVISEVEHINRSHLDFAIMQESGEPITVLCRSIDLSEQAFVEICMMRQALLKLPLSMTSKMVKSFNSLDPEHAKRSIRHLKLKNHIEEHAQ